ILSDVVLPAATWYEKHDVNTTDMHPFIHSFNPAISPPSPSRTDWGAWKAIAKEFSDLAKPHLGTRTDIVAKPLWQESPEAWARPGGQVKYWRAGECDRVPGKTMRKLLPVERDLTAVYEKRTSIDPLVDYLGTTTKGVTCDVRPEVEQTGRANGRR